MDNTQAGPDPKSQLDKFKDAAREVGADENAARWDDRLKKVVKPKLGKPNPQAE